MVHKSRTSMKKFTLLFALVVMLQFSSAQSFTLSPGNSVSGNVDYNGSLDLQINMDNATASDLTLGYERISNTCPTEWFTALCDYPNCYPTIPASNTMSPVGQGGHGFLKLTIQPSGYAGSATVVFRVFDANNPSDDTTVTFNINSVVGIDRYDLSGKVTMYPNPATDNFRLAAINGTLETGTLRVMSITGAEVLNTEIGTSAFQQVNVGELAPGVYLVKYETTEGIFSKKLIIN